MHSLIFVLPKNVRLNHCPQNLSFPLRVSRVIMNSTHYFIIKTSNKRELQQIVYNHSSHIDFKDFMNFYKNVLPNCILFMLLKLLLDQITLYVSERIFREEYKN